MLSNILRLSCILNKNKINIVNKLTISTIKLLQYRNINIYNNIIYDDIIYDGLNNNIKTEDVKNIKDENISMNKKSELKVGDTIVVERLIKEDEINNASIDIKPSYTIELVSYSSLNELNYAILNYIYEFIKLYFNLNKNSEYLKQNYNYINNILNSKNIHIDEYKILTIMNYITHKPNYNNILNELIISIANLISFQDYIRPDNNSYHYLLFLYTLNNDLYSITRLELYLNSINIKLSIKSEFLKFKFFIINDKFELDYISNHFNTTIEPMLAKIIHDSNEINSLLICLSRYEKYLPMFKAVLKSYMTISLLNPNVVRETLLKLFIKLSSGDLKALPFLKEIWTYLYDFLNHCDYKNEEIEALFFIFAKSGDWENALTSFRLLQINKHEMNAEYYLALLECCRIYNCRLEFYSILKFLPLKIFALDSIIVFKIIEIYIELMSWVEPKKSLSCLSIMRTTKPIFLNSVFFNFNTKSIKVASTPLNSSSLNIAGWLETFTKLKHFGYIWKWDDALLILSHPLILKHEKLAFELFYTLIKNGIIDLFTVSTSYQNINFKFHVSLINIIMNFEALNPNFSIHDSTPNASNIEVVEPIGRLLQKKFHGTTSFANVFCSKFISNLLRSPLFASRDISSTTKIFEMVNYLPYDDWVLFLSSNYFSNEESSTKLKTIAANILLSQIDRNRPFVQATNKTHLNKSVLNWKITNTTTNTNLIESGFKSKKFRDLCLKISKSDPILTLTFQRILDIINKYY